jgi:hypothetical protein
MKITQPEEKCLLSYNKTKASHMFEHDNSLNVGMVHTLLFL